MIENGSTLRGTVVNKISSRVHELFNRRKSPEISGSIFDRFPKLKEIPEENFPNHLCLIMDGNRRWARTVFGEAVKAIKGHEQGSESVINVLRDLRQLPIRYVSLWAFAADNWNRPNDEISDLMNLMEKTLPKMAEELHQYKGRFVHLGRRDRLRKRAPGLLREIDLAQEKTKQNEGQRVVLLIDYGGEDQELLAMQNLVDMQLPAGTKVTPELRADLLGLNIGNGETIPPSNVTYRTYGENRLSDIGQIARDTRIIPIEKPLPEVTIADFVPGLIWYSQQEIRKGK